MQNHARQSVASIFSPTKWAIAPGALYGLVHGSILLNESVDLATAFGIAAFVSLAVGPWLAVNLDRLLMRGYAIWMTAIVVRLSVSEAFLLAGREPAEQRHDESVAVGMVTRVVGYSFYVTILCFGAATTGTLLTITTARIEGVNHVYYMVATALWLFVLVCTIAAQCLYFGMMHRQVAVMEAQTRLTGEAARRSSPMTTQAATLFESIARTEKIGRRVVGMKPISVK